MSPLPRHQRTAQNTRVPGRLSRAAVPVTVEQDVGVVNLEDWARQYVALVRTLMPDEDALDRAG